MTATALTFVVFLLGFTALGLYAATRKRETTEDYLLASRTVPPWLVGLSAVATNNSGFMFVGLISTAYTIGISAVWIMVGFVGGDWVAWSIGVHRRLRIRSAEINANSIPRFLGAGLGRHERLVVMLGGLITLVFLSIYAAAQLNAGSKALHEIFGWDFRTGAIIGAVIVVSYCFAGGIRASIWTDAAQSFVMFGSMSLLLVVAISEIGGFGALWDRATAIDPQLTSFAAPNVAYGTVLYTIGWIVGGFGVIGQPHIMVRAMALDSPANAGKARNVYVSWYAVFSILCVLVGLAARVLLPAIDGYDSQLALPNLSSQLLPATLVGLMLAGLFAATISTADSQILSCSAAITQDLAPSLFRSYSRVKLATIAVAVFALLIALNPDAKVFGLVALAWGGLASGLGPLLALRSFGRPVSAPVALAMMIVGIASAYLWGYTLGQTDHLYEVLPGLAAGFAVYFVATTTGLNRSPNSPA